MTELPPNPQHHWTIIEWLGGLSTIIAIVWAVIWAAIVSGFKKWVKDLIWDRIFKKRKQEILTEKERAVQNGEFESFKETTAARMGELGQVVHAGVLEMSDTAQETRETLRLFDLKQDSKLDDIYQRTNATSVDVAKLQQKVEDMPDVIVGKILQILPKDK